MLILISSFLPCCLLLFGINQLSNPFGFSNYMALLKIEAMISTGSTEEAWFDTFSAVASDEEDFRSVQDGTTLHISD